MKKISKMLFVVGFTYGCSMLLFGQDVQAYIDPSVMTYVIQAVAGVVITLSFVFFSFVMLKAAFAVYLQKGKEKTK